MIRLLLVLLFLFSTLYSKEYPKSYAQLGSPLFSSLEPFLELKDLKLLKNDIYSFEKHIQPVLNEGFKVDISNEKSEKKEYLKNLRKLQKEYDQLLYKIHQAISFSIDNTDYKSFIRLTEYPFDGLFKNRALKEKAIKFYVKNKKICECKVLDNEINDSKLLEETDKYFEEVVAINSSYNSNSKKKSKKKVIIETKRVKNRISVELVNKNLYPVTIKIKPYYENLTPSSDTQDELVLKANSITHYTDLDISRGRSYYSYKFSWMMGSKDAKHDDTYVYRLPYKVGTMFIRNSVDHIYSLNEYQEITTTGELHKK